MRYWPPPAAPIGIARFGKCKSTTAALARFSKGRPPKSQYVNDTWPLETLAAPRPLFQLQPGILLGVSKINANRVADMPPCNKFPAIPV